MVTTANASSSKPTARKAKLSTRSTAAASRSRSATLKAGTAAFAHSQYEEPPLLSDSHHYMSDEMEDIQQRQDYDSNVIRCQSDEERRMGCDDDDEARDEFPVESYLGEDAALTTVPVLSNHTLLPYPNTAGAVAPNNTPGIEGELNNLMIDSHNSWDMLNQNDSFGFDFTNKGGEMSLSFESHDYNGVLDTPAVTQSISHDPIDWSTAAPRVDEYGNLIPSLTSPTSAEAMAAASMDVVSANHDMSSYHAMVLMTAPSAEDGGMRKNGKRGEDPIAEDALAAAGDGGNQKKKKTRKTKSSSGRERKKKAASTAATNGDGKKKKVRTPRKNSKRERDQQKQTGGNLVGNNGLLTDGIYSGSIDIPELVSSSSTTSMGVMQHHGFMPPSHAHGSVSPSEFLPPSNTQPSQTRSLSNKVLTTSNQLAAAFGVPSLPPSNHSGIALLTTDSGVVLTRDQAPGIGWPVNEDMLLHEVMTHQKSPVNWETVSRDMNCGRSARECHDRWTRYLKPGTRKGQWTEEEDAAVLKVIAVSPDQPFTQWADLAPLLPGRSGKQIRDRWVNYLNPSINHLPFSREDDLKLWHGHRELGKRWVEISGKIFNSTRSENHIKNRWYSAAFKKFIASEFGNSAYIKVSPSVSSTKAGKKGAAKAKQATAKASV
ncbi:hypothetical protein ACHAWC_003803 [Mediolabrus comicus]